jgi:hypothetical protein
MHVAFLNTLIWNEVIVFTQSSATRSLHQLAKLQRLQKYRIVTYPGYIA